jgi:hypothetical protein
MTSQSFEVQMQLWDLKDLSVTFVNKYGFVSVRYEQPNWSRITTNYMPSYK